MTRRLSLFFYYLIVNFMGFTCILLSDNHPIVRNVMLITTVFLVFREFLGNWKEELYDGVLEYVLSFFVGAGLSLFFVIQLNL